mmetsp:Transcript_34142/g.54687  ORF Transcript_34142/g.54687 Transcript_34142/m.54687 type:complete len:450 (-) Transcript_34142:86-1435(-)|eukprot:CAMPEP_0203745808 /NCGR_PEP_ID=MMETSP0098-20131031/1434_1 /ASSEMBLY_ACC=CAM_ASM_000208 /TAXON_ID=96639 /ORGANISM=" , Strain NY0313808BC1" /LENGTH=449 /DNA_ID=CAMNT_0050633701 /DNA_START=323 /DNA_END=1672 /DNA_ORIENTATION=-
MIGRGVVLALVGLVTSTEAICPSSSAELLNAVDLTIACYVNKSATTCSLCDTTPYFDCNVTVSDLAISFGTSIICNSPYNACSDTLESGLLTACAAYLGAGTAVNCTDGLVGEIPVSPGYENSGQSDVNCGGSHCQRCILGGHCRRDSDCAQDLVCESDVCAHLSADTNSDILVYFHEISIPILVITALGTLAAMQYNMYIEKRRNKKEAKKEQADAQKRELDSRRATKGTSRANSSSQGMRLAMKTSLAHSGDSDSFSGVSPYSSLTSVLENPKSKRKFHAFLNRKFAGENILFWDAIREYEIMWDTPNTPNEDIQLKARHIVDKFIHDGGASEVNLAYFRRCEILSLYEQSDKDCQKQVFQRHTFDEAKEEIFDLMNCNFLSSFIHSETGSTKFLNRNSTDLGEEDVSAQVGGEPSTESMKVSSAEILADKTPGAEDADIEVQIVET